MSDAYYEEEEFTSQHTGKTFRRILGLTRPYLSWVIGFLFMIALVSIIDSFFTYLSKQIIDTAIVPGDKAALVHLVTIYASLILFQAVFVFGFIFLAGVLGERIRYDLRQGLFNHLQDLSLSYYNQTPVGWIMSRVTSDSDRVAELITWGLLDVSWGIMNILTATFFMMVINWRLGMIVFMMIPVLVLVAIWFQRKILRQFRASRKFNSKITSAYNENITGVRVVKALGREDENIREFSHLTDQMYAASYRAAWLSALFLPTVQVISAFALAAVVWYGGLQASYGAMTIGGIQAFVTYIIFMMWPIQEMARVFAELQHAIASGERMFSLMDATPAIIDRPDAVDPGTIHGRIDFDHVAFAYEDGKPVLSDFSLKVEPGETIALVGPTGGGKTTIVNLLCRFFEPVRGRHPHQRAGLHTVIHEFNSITYRRRPANAAPVFRHDPGEYSLREAGCL